MQKCYITEEDSGTKYFNKSQGERRGIYVENSVLIKKNKKNKHFLNYKSGNTYFIIFVLWTLNFVDQRIYG